MPPEPTTVVLTGIGLCSALGDAVTACAAARAGLSRAGSLAYQLEDDTTGIPEAARGHQALAAAAFVGKGRLVALAEAALADLAAATALWPDPGRGSFHLCFTDQDTRRWQPEETPPAEAVRAQLRADEGEREEVAQRALELAGLGGKADACRVYATGGGGLALAVDEATAALRERRCDYCLVGAVDTLVTPPVVAFLHEGSRLKTPDEPCGLIPGEAAAFWLLEPLERARQRQRPVLGIIGGTARATAEDPDVAGRPPRGEAWLAVCRSLLPDGAATTALPWLLVDQNGEAFWAAEWGDFLGRATKDLPAAAQAAVWYPAIPFGDTGAAAGLVAGCMTVMAWRRGYAPSATALLLSSTYEGARSGVRIDQGQATPSQGVP